MKNKHLILFPAAMVVGAVSGAMAIGFRLLLENTESALKAVLNLDVDMWMLVVGWFLALSLLAAAVGLIIDWNKSLPDGGVSRMIQVYRRGIPSVWWKNILGNLVGVPLTLFAGLSVGLASPVIQFGGASANGLAHIVKFVRPYAKTLMLLGASAGFTVAFSAPCSGMIFGLTMIRRRWSTVVFIYSALASWVAYLLVLLVYGRKPFFDLELQVPDSLPEYGMLLFLSVIIAFFGIFYNRILMVTQRDFDTMKVKYYYFKLLPVFMLSGVFAFTVPEILGSGAYTFETVMFRDVAIPMLAVMLVARFVFSMLSPASGVPGGLMFPILTLGALAGKLFAEIMASYALLEPQYVLSFVVFGMAGMFSATVRTPLLAVFLLVETTWQFGCIPGLMLIAAVCTLIPELIGNAPIFESLGDRIYARYREELK